MEYKYRYLHICPPSTRMMKGFIMMLNNYFTPSEHYILCRITSDGKDGFTSLSNNIINWKDLGRGKIRKFIGAVRVMKDSKNIVVHGFTFSLKWLLLMYFYREQIEKKGIWVIWGVDLYNYRRTTGNRFINKIINHMEDKVRESCRTSVVIFPTDIAVFKKIFGDEKTVFCAPLGFSKSSFEEWDAILEKRRAAALKYPNAFTRPDRKVSIQVGHNSYPFNNHALALGALEQYRDKNILITMPMSYGNEYGGKAGNYREDIMHLAYNLFPHEKIRQLKDLMPLRKYYEFLGAVDVAILCAPRQNALGNITPLLYMGKKVYLSTDNPLFSFFKSKGFEIHDVKEIADTKYEDLIEPVKKIFPNPWIKNYYSVDGNARRWEVVFGYSDGKYTKEEAYSIMAEYDREEELAVKEYIAEDKNRQECSSEVRGEELLQVYNWLKARDEEDRKALEEKENRRAKWLALVAKRREEIAREQQQKKKKDPVIVVKQADLLKDREEDKKKGRLTKVEALGPAEPSFDDGEYVFEPRYLLVIEREKAKG